jgi:CubicO group peptidase (beta-lactamase class C family)
MRLLLFAVLGGWLSSYPVFGQNVVDSIDEYLTRWELSGRFNGSVLVAEQNEVFFKKGFGYANLEHKIPNRSDTRFNIGSISKQFTTVLAFLLIEEGKLKLDGPISEYLPDYRQDIGNKITIDHLLQHTSGIPCYLRDYERQEDDDFRLPFPEWKRFPRGAFIEDFLSGDLQFEPGSRYRYSNTNFFLLYVIIEAVTEKSFETNLEDKIFGPLGMKKSGLIDDYKIIEDRATGYNKTPAGYLKAKYVYAPNTYGAGSLFSTVEDLFIWNRALRSGRILPAGWQEKMFAPYMEEGRYVKHAYSIDYYTMRMPDNTGSIPYTSFNGALPGFITDAFTFPETGHTIIIFDNTERFNHIRMATDIYKILRGNPYELPKPLAADVIGEIAVKKGISQAVEAFRDLKKNGIADYDFDSVENILSDQGYLLADASRMDEALLLFGLVAQLNPTSPAPQNDLGRIYKKMGRMDLANEAFGRAKDLTQREGELYSLIKNGDWEKAKKMVEKIQKETPSEALFVSSRIGPLFGEAFGKGDMERAVQICDLWVLGNPGEVGPYFSLARVYQKLGKKEEAIRCYEKILEIAPAGRHVSTAKMRLQELKKE